MKQQTNTEMSEDCGFECPVEATLEVITGKWKTLILYHLFSGTKRFSELRKLLPQVTQRILTRQLRELELDNIVNRQVYIQVPPKLEYSLTESGKSLERIFQILHDWGSVYIDGSSTPRPQKSRESTQEKELRHQGHQPEFLK